MTQSQLSWETRLAAALLGIGAALGVGIVGLGFVLMGNDPGFLFAVLPIIFLVLTVAGVTIATFSWALVIRLRRATPGVRMEVALMGGCLVISGVFVAEGSMPAAVFLVLYGATLLWLMTTPAAARDLGGWIAPARRAWFAGSATPQRPWWETWRAGLAQGMPLWELLLVAAALLAFVVGLVCVPLGFALYPALRPLSLWLVPLAVAVVWFVEQRMKARLARG
jgi:hypothetical protein